MAGPQKVQVKMELPLDVNHGEGHIAHGEAIQGRVLDSLQLWQGLHLGDGEETGDQDEGASRSLQEEGAGKGGNCKTHLENTLPHQMGGDFDSGLCQKTQGAVAEGGPPHPDDRC